MPVTDGPPAIVAVYCTLCPKTDGLALDVTDVVVVVRTVCVSAGDVLVVKLPSPL